MSSKTKTKQAPFIGKSAPLVLATAKAGLVDEKAKVKSKNFTENLSRFINLLPLVTLLSVGLLPLLFLPDTAGHLSAFINIFLGLVCEALPFLLLGAILAAILANRVAPKPLFGFKRAGAISFGIGMSMLLPVCECGAASIARQATKAGAPIVTSIVFLLAAPIANPITLFTTWLAFSGDWTMVLGRLGLGVFVAVALGLLLSLYPQPQQLFNPAVFDEKHDGHDHALGEECNHPPFQPPKLTNRLALIADNTIIEFLQATKIVLPGIAMAAAFQAYVAQRFFLDMGQGALLSVVALMLLASLMSVCTSVDAFVALTFTNLFPGGAVLAFLVFGSLVNLKTIFLMRLVLRWRIIGLIALLTFQVVLLVGVFINLRVG